jgi:hypothetical protein
VIVAVPLKETAKELGLCIHEADTFTGWNVSLRQGIGYDLILF